MLDPAHDTSFQEASDAYEAWLETYCALDPEGLARKREKMRKSPFALLRGSFFRWPHALRSVDPAVLAAPSILCVADIHLENFGTWRDQEGRLVWGVNDFDEAAELPFTSDLIRLAASARLESASKSFALSAEEAVEAIEGGYRKRLTSGSHEPYVLENRHPKLRDLAAVRGKDAVKDWEKLQADREVAGADLPAGLHDLLLTCLPSGARNVRIYRRLSGLGSLGRQKYVAVGEWYGGLIAREAKAAAPSAIWMGGGRMAEPLRDYRRIEALGYRARDPFLHLADAWVIRRLSPESRKIEIGDVEEAPDQAYLLRCMGKELANIHLGTAGQPDRLSRFLDTLDNDWLQDAARITAAAVEADYEELCG